MPEMFEVPRKRIPFRHGHPVVDVLSFISPHLPRVPGGRGYCIGRRWRGCHNSAASYKTCAAGFPPSLWEAVRKYHCSPYRSRRSRSHSGLQRITLAARTACPIFPLSQAVVPAPLPIPLLYGFRTRNTVCSVFKVHEESRGKILFTLQRTT